MKPGPRPKAPQLALIPGGRERGRDRKVEKVKRKRRKAVGPETPKSPDPPPPPKSGKVERIRPPSWLKGEARRKYLEVGNALRKRGVLDKVDRDALLVYATTWARWIKAQRELLFGDAEGGVVELTNAEGKVYGSGPSPWIAIEAKLNVQVRQWQNELGLTPSARDGLQHELPYHDAIDRKHFST